MYLFTRLKYFVKNMKESFYDFSELDKFNQISNVLTLSVSANNLNQKRCQTNAWTNVYDYTHSMSLCQCQHYFVVANIFV